MAARKPLVLKDGLIEQLQSGDTLDAPVSSAIILTMTNNLGSTLNKCQVVFCDSPDSVQLARANNISTVHAVGMSSQNSITHTSPAVIHLKGVLTALDTEWQSVVEGGSVISAGTVYYLSAANAGKITDTAPTTAGQFVLRLGVALSTTEFLVDIQAAIKL